MISYRDLESEFQQQHPRFLPLFEMKSFIMGGLLLGGRPLPCSCNSSSNKKHYRMVSDANEKTLMNMAPTTYPIMPATTHGK